MMTVKSTLHTTEKPALAEMRTSDTTVPISSTVGSMDVILRTKDATYLRIPTGMQRSAGLCACSKCEGREGYWDTLVVPTSSPKHGGDYASTVHMPDPATSRAWHAKKGTLITFAEVQKEGAK